MINYNKMFHKTNFLLKDFASSSNSFREPFYIDLNPSEENLLKMLVIKAFNLFDGTTGGDGGEGVLALDLYETLDMNYPDKAALLKHLKLILPSFGGKERRLFEKLIKALELFIVQEEDDQSTPTERIENSLIAPYVPKEHNPNVVRLFQLREFAFNRQKDPNYFPTLVPYQNVEKYQNLSRREIANLFSKDNFYNLSKNEVPALLQAAVNEYLIQNSVQPCAVIFEDQPLGNGSVQYGEYDPNRGAIFMNKKVLDLFEQAKQEGNQSFPLQLLSTAIHEARHRVQFSKINSTDLSSQDQVVVSALTSPERRTTFAEYLSAPEELDARQAALEYLYECSSLTNNDGFKAYYNERLKDEKRSKKAEVPPLIKDIFKGIYQSQQIETSLSLSKDFKNFKNMLSSSSNEFSR